MKYLLLGSRSFLGASYSKYLSEKKIQVLSLSQINSQNYSKNFIEKSIDSFKPSKIYDFRFPLVSSNDELYKKINTKDFFKTQIEFIDVINNLSKNVPEIYLISSSNITKKKNVYTSLKKKQEDIYKKNLLNNKKLRILRLNAVLGEGDLNVNRLIPYFFKSIFVHNYVNLEINSNSIGNFSFVGDTNEYLYSHTVNKQKNFKVKYKILIYTLSDILKSKYKLYHQVDWNKKDLLSNSLNKSDTFYANLENMTDWYYQNRHKFMESI